ncbi:hypothetical protein SDC9_173630 [bioreactor metagenome]|uniref:Uncharacterized protein n=1 Tax=bioreactor metagenome TaxID=1076179 RepID=A0A645GIZ3_9ZZZZ
MLGLQIAAPFHWVFKLRAALLQRIHSLCVGDALKIVVHYVLQPVKEALIHEFVEKLEFIGAAIHDGTDNGLYHSLRNFQIAGKVAKSHLWFDHPKLGGMAGGVAVFRPEGWAKGIDIPECQRIGFPIKLTGNGEVGVSAEEIPAIVHGAVLGAGRIVHIQGRHLEHFPRSLAIAPG